MPFGDGTGPRGKGAGAGKGRGRMGGMNPGADPEGFCICPNCRIKVPHEPGKPCYSIKCPKCGAQMIRE
jgi:hypothetical protein